MFKYTVFGEFVDIIKTGRRKRKWHKLYPNSDTFPMNQFRFDHVSVGNGTYGELNVVDFGGDSNLVLKNYVSIAQNVTFVLNAEHPLNHISTYPFKVKMLGISQAESFGKGDIIVEDDVWIGYGATILSGVHIEQGACVAAGAVVSKNVPPYAVVAGNPAKIVKYRFDTETISNLNKRDLSKIDVNIAKSNLENLYADEVNESTISWIPLKQKVGDK